MAKLVVLRDVTTDECDWLDETVPEGAIVYEYHGCTYGCISYDGIAVTIEPDKTPFFELPLSALARA